MYFWVRDLPLKISIFQFFFKCKKVVILFCKFLHKKVFTEKWSTPWQSRRKIHRNCQLRFLIFETSSQRFLTTKFPLFQNVKLSQKVKKWQFWFANFSMKKVFTEKMEYTMTKPTENPSKLSTQIFNFWKFVTEIFNHKIPFI